MATASTTPAATKPVTKADKAKVIFDEVRAEGYDLNGLTPRGAFMKRAQEEASMTKAGAGTYYQNFLNEARDGKRYKYSSSKKETPAAEADPVPPTADDVKKAEAQVLADLSHRWQVIDETGSVIDTFPSRAKAQEAAAERGLKWKDGQAA